MTDLVERLRALAAEKTLKCWEPRHGSWLSALRDSATAIETLTRENALVKQYLDNTALRCTEFKAENKALLARAEAAESALREALDVTRNLLRRIDNHFNSYPEWDWQEQTAARAFIEKHAPAATSEDK